METHDEFGLFVICFVDFILWAQLSPLVKCMDAVHQALRVS